MNTQSGQNKIVIFDIESSNHLQKECSGDFAKLKIGLAGVKYIEEERYEFYSEENLSELAEFLSDAEVIIGFNLVGHNGFDFQMLENHGINTDNLLLKTYDIMTTFIRVFGSYKDMSLSNIAKNTFQIKKKKSRKANYKLIRNGEIEKVKNNLKQELGIIEKVFIRIMDGGMICFQTPSGLIDKHEMPSQFYLGLPHTEEPVIDPYDFPFAGMRLEIKDREEIEVKCHNCKKTWKIESVTYYGDTMSEEVTCPNCEKCLTKTRTSLFGEAVKITEL